MDKDVYTDIVKEIKTNAFKIIYHYSENFSYFPLFRIKNKAIGWK